MKKWEVYGWFIHKGYDVLGGVAAEHEQTAVACALLFVGEWSASNRKLVTRVSVIEVDAAGEVVKPGGGYASAEMR